MVSIVPALGVLSLGIIIGWLIRFFIKRFKSFTPKALTSVVTLIVGGSTVKLLGADKTLFWFYPIGLLAGFTIYTILALWVLGLPSTSSRNENRECNKNKNETSFNPEDYDGVLYKPRKKEEQK